MPSGSEIAVVERVTPADVQALKPGRQRYGLLMTPTGGIFDDFMVAKIHTRYLATVSGFRVVGTVHTGTEALAALTELHPDLMLLDVYLPDMTGIEVLRRARQDFPDVDVIVVTAARELDTVREAMQGGAVSYLVKPFEYQALGERLKHYRRTRSALSTSDVADQKQIDQLFGLPAESGATDQADLPKGLSRETALSVLAILTKNERYHGALAIFSILYLVIYPLTNLQTVQ